MRHKWRRRCALRLHAARRVPFRRVRVPLKRRRLERCSLCVQIVYYRGGRKIIIGSKGLFCDLESTRRVCLCTLYPKPNPSKAISCVLSPKMNSPAHQTCDFMVNFGAENGNFWHISLLWHVAQIRGSMLKKIAQIRAFHDNQARYWSV